MTIPAFLPLCNCAGCTEQRIRDRVEEYQAYFRANGFAIRDPRTPEDEEAWKRFKASRLSAG